MSTLQLYINSISFLVGFVVVIYPKRVYIPIQSTDNLDFISVPFKEYFNLVDNITTRLDRKETIDRNVTQAISDGSIVAYEVRHANSLILVGSQTEKGLKQHVDFDIVGIRMYK